MITRYVLSIFLALASASAAPLPMPEWHFVPPTGSGVVNVKDFGAKGDGKTDDTVAIGKAITANIDKSRYRASAMIYFPNGTYLVSGPIESRLLAPGYDQGKVWSAGWRSMLVMIGESRAGTVIKLADKAVDYADPAKPQWIIATGSESDGNKNFKGEGNRAFRHGILNMTIDAGTGNPGAIGVDFLANNRGAIDGVTIRAGAGSGHTAIAMTRAWPGPAMIHDVKIEGYAQGMALSHYQHGMTFENIEMSGQREVGIANTGNVLAMRRIRFTGPAPFYIAKGGHSLLSLLDSTIEGGDPATAAITSAGMVNLRRVKVSGYGQALDDTTKANRDLPAGTIASHDQGFTLDAGGKPATALDLPIEEIPAIRPPANAPWVDGGATRESLQAAIDRGAEWIYIKPLQTIKLDDTLVLRGKVRLILGLNGCIAGPRDKAAIRVDEGETPVVALEHVFIDGFVEHPSARTFVLRHGDIGAMHEGEGWKGLVATGPGKSHIIDVIGRGYQIGPQHKLWARQLNAEFGTEPLYTNAGSSWILGFKMESSPRGKNAPLSTPSLLNRSGRLEVFAGLLYTLGSKREHAPLVPAFTNEQGQFAVSYRTNGIPDTYYKSILRMGSFTGTNDLTSDKIKGPGAALLTDRR